MNDHARAPRGVVLLLYIEEMQIFVAAASHDSDRLRTATSKRMQPEVVIRDS